MLEVGVNDLIVVIWVVMEENEFLHAGLEGEGDGVIHTAVTPAGVELVFLAVVLGIENKNVGVTDEFNHVAIIPAGPWLGVGKETDESVGREQPVADGDAGMIGAVGANQNAANGEIKIAQLLDLDIARQFGKWNGKVGALHLAG